MHFRTILVDLSDGPGCKERVQSAARLALSCGGTVVGITATGPQLEPFRGAGEEAGTYEALAAGKRRQMSDRGQATLEALVRPVSPAIRTLHRLIEAEAGWALATEGRFADLILPAPPSIHTDVPVGLAGVAEYALLHAGRPILLLPGLASAQVRCRIGIAWNGSRAAARAVADALAWMAQASSVSVLMIADRPEAESSHGDTSHESGRRLIGWLASHGIVADLHMGAGNPDDALPDLAAALRVELLVAGGYGHSRLRELVVGGSTKSLLHQTRIPVFMSH